MRTIIRQPVAAPYLVSVGAQLCRSVSQNGGIGPTAESAHSEVAIRGMAGITQPLVRNLGDYIRGQRRSSHISLRQLARLAGVSNPYLSQIERGLRKPSAQILQQIAKALRISAEALYVQAGILEYREGSGEVVDAVHREQGLTERQKQVLIEIYDSFRKENDGRAAESDRLAAASALVDEPNASPPAGPTRPPGRRSPCGTSRRSRSGPASAARSAPARGAPRRQPHRCLPGTPGSRPARRAPRQRSATTWRSAAGSGHWACAAPARSGSGRGWRPRRAGPADAARSASCDAARGCSHRGCAPTAE